MSDTPPPPDIVKHRRSSSAFVGNRCERLLGNKGKKKQKKNPIVRMSALPNHPKEVETFIHSVAQLFFFFFFLEVAVKGNEHTLKHSVIPVA